MYWIRIVDYTFNASRLKLLFWLASVCLCVCMCVLFSQWGQRRRCKASYTSPGPIRLIHQGCYSTRAYQLRYCGQCTDSRCCTPYQTTTAEVTFRCPTGRLLQRPVMMIHSCVCHNNCPYSPYSNPALWGYRPWSVCMSTDSFRTGRLHWLIWGVDSDRNLIYHQVDPHRHPLINGPWKRKW